MTHLQERALGFVRKNRFRLRTLFDWMDTSYEQLISTPKLIPQWLLTNEVELMNFLDGRDGVFSDEKRELKDILHMARKENVFIRG